MCKKIINFNKLQNLKSMIIVLLLLTIISSNLSLAQNTFQDNKISFSAGFLHLLQNSKNPSSSSKYKRLYNNISFSLLYSYRINKDISVGMRVILNKFEKNRVVKNNYSSLPVFFAFNYRLIRRAGLYLQFNIGPVFYLDKENEYSITKSKIGFGTAVSTSFYFKLIENLLANIEWGLVYENSVPQNLSTKSTGLYTILVVGLAISF